jgi:hypothetical protein
VWAAAVTLAALLAGCSSGAPEPDRAGQVDEQPTEDASTAPGHAGEQVKAPPSRPLRPGERRLTLEMDEAYTPAAPTGFGTDDYRCFLLDPELQRDVYLTGTDVRPGDPDLVHHVILFHVPPDSVPDAQQLDDSTDGPGWTCFGGSGLERGPSLDSAPWLGAWAPGGGETVQRTGYGKRLPKGSLIVMQVHYNLLAGSHPDTSATRLRVAPLTSSITPVHTMLLPAPVELPCRPRHSDEPLCSRPAALADVKKRFGDGPGSTADLLYFVCGGKPRPGPVQSCTRTVPQPMNVMAAAGHMHLLGRSIRIEVNPGTPEARTVLNIRAWDFDNQGARPIKPVRLEPFDTVKVTCRHSQRVRDFLPEFEDQPERYVLWGEGTTDEMCLGILQYTEPS